MRSSLVLTKQQSYTDGARVFCAMEYGGDLGVINMLPHLRNPHIMRVVKVLQS